MKLHFRKLLIFGAFASIVAFSRCQKGDSAKPFGLTNIYMPQSLSSGGVNLNYIVPSGLDSATHNYTIDSINNKLEVILGVSRSGKEPSGGYSVAIETNADTIQAAITNGTLQAELLPDKSYSLPAEVKVPAGQYAATFYLSVDIDQLKMFAGKKVALAVKISQSSRYQIDLNHAETIVIIDVSALNLP